MRSVFWATFCLTLVASPRLWANNRQGGESDDEAKAHKVYSEGEASYRLGKYEQAAQKFEEAYRLSKAPNLLFDAAQAYRRVYEQSKKTEHARQAQQLYRNFLNVATPGDKMRPKAEKFLAELDNILKAVLEQEHSA